MLNGFLSLEKARDISFAKWFDNREKAVIFVEFDLNSLRFVI